MVGNPPYAYEILNRIDSQTPQSFLRIHNTYVARFFKKYLLQDAISTIKFKLPEMWDMDYFRYCLFGLGYVAILRTDMYGVIPQNCTLSGMNVFYRPTTALVSNPHLQSKELVINRECALVKLMPDYSSITDLVDYYGDLMALAYESLSVNILNSRLAYLIGVSGKPEADTFKALFDDILSGKPAVVYKKKESVTTAMKTGSQWETLIQNVRQSFIAPELVDTITQIRDEFLTVIGIPTISDRKKERVNVIDSLRNTAETDTKIDLWLEEVNAGIAKAIELFPELSGSFTAEKRFKGERENVSQAVSNRAV